MLIPGIKPMGRKAKPARKKSPSKVRTVPQESLAVPTTERLERKYVFTTFTPTGERVDIELGNGFTLAAVGVDPAGRVNERAYKNRIESPLDVLLMAKILRPKEGDINRVEHRRYAAGVALYKIYHDAHIEQSVTAGFDKCFGIIMPGQFAGEKSDYADAQHARYNRIHRALHPYQHVVENICCKGEGYESRLKERLLAGLDRLADIMFGKIDYRTRPIIGGPVDHDASSSPDEA